MGVEAAAEAGEGEDAAGADEEGEREAVGGEAGAEHPDVEAEGVGGVGAAGEGPDPIQFIELVRLRICFFFYTFIFSNGVTLYFMHQFSIVIRSFNTSFGNSTRGG